MMLVYSQIFTKLNYDNYSLLDCVAPILVVAHKVVQ